MTTTHTTTPRDGPSTADLANVLRALAMDAVQQANSGHPGMPMGMAEIAVALWTRHLKHNPANPKWADRDRFVLSNGHGSMLLYALLHLTGYALPMAELVNFRQLDSLTPGHPETGHTPGVETTTGPLGQGLANAVGMALAEALLAAEFNRPDHTIVDHTTYAFVGDGCLMEGISHEACSLAGTLGLRKLIVFYDDNGISIDGETKHWFADDTPKRFEAYGWRVIPGIDGHDVDAVDNAIALAKQSDRPTLICCKTTIGKGSPNRANTAKAHGEALGAPEVALTRAALGWAHAPFEVPQNVRAAWDARETGARHETAWNERFAAYAARHPDKAAEFVRRMAGNLPLDWTTRAQSMLTKLAAGAESIATRKASQNAIAALVDALPELIGGSADLTGSNLTDWKGAKALRAETLALGTPARHINYGVREFAMAATMNGIALHGGFIPFGGTFLTFSDYSRNALRMAALMRRRVIHVFTHDSIGLGEDGPTHQPVEHLASLRLIPNLDLWRPCDQAETTVAWLAAVTDASRPTCLALSRQAVPAASRNAMQLADIAKGGYVLADTLEPAAIIIATGSEVQLALRAREALATQGIDVRVVSMPSTSVFDRQSNAYRDAVLPQDIPCVAVEAGVTQPWRAYVGRRGEVVGIDTYGASAPAPQLFERYGITVDAVCAAVKRVIERSGYSTAPERALAAASIASNVRVARPAEVSASQI